MIKTANEIKEAYYFLYYGADKRNIVLYKEEQNFIACLMNAEFCMDASIGFIEDDKIKVVSGALMGAESQIKKGA